jgi:hypothetical protein
LKWRIGPELGLGETTLGGWFFLGREQAQQPKDAEYQEDESMHYRETRTYQSFPNVSSF